MLKDVESMDYEQRVQSELDPLIQRDVKVPTKQEAHVAYTQFLALCLSLFVMGWTDGSTGPLLPRIQGFYYVSRTICYSFLTSHEFCRWGSEQCLGYLFCNVRLVRDTRCCSD